MIINRNTLPLDFVAAFNSRKLVRERGSWQLKNNIDFWGNALETELGCFYKTREQLVIQTSKLNDSFLPLNGDENEFTGLGSIPYIDCFDQIVEFGICGGGSPFCLDFRDDQYNPRVIWWDDVYWRVIAPSFDKYISLFDLEK